MKILNLKLLLERLLSITHHMEEKLQIGCGLPSRPILPNPCVYTSALIDFSVKIITTGDAKLLFFPKFMKEIAKDQI